MLKRFEEFVNEEAAKDVGNLTGILDTKIDWYGEDPKDKSKFYEDFKKPVYSVRATFSNILSYAKKHDIKSIRGIVARWSLGKTPDTLTEADQKNFNDYLTALKRYSNIEANASIEYKDGKLVEDKDNIVTLFKLVQGIIQHESGNLDADDLGEYKTVQQIVVAGFELETNDPKSLPAYKKYGIDIESDTYKAAREEYLNGQTVAKTEKTEKVDKKDAFKKILKDFK